MDIDPPGLAMARAADANAEGSQLFLPAPVFLSSGLRLNLTKSLHASDNGREGHKEVELLRHFLLRCS